MLFAFGLVAVALLHGVAAAAAVSEAFFFAPATGAGRADTGSRNIQGRFLLYQCSGIFDVSQNFLHLLLRRHVLAAAIRSKELTKQLSFCGNAFQILGAGDSQAVTAIRSIVRCTNIFGKRAKNLSVWISVFDPCGDLRQKVEVQTMHSTSAFILDRASEL